MHASTTCPVAQLPSAPRLVYPPPPLPSSHLVVCFVSERERGTESFPKARGKSPMCIPIPIPPSPPPGSFFPLPSSAEKSGNKCQGHQYRSRQSCMSDHPSFTPRHPSSYSLFSPPPNPRQKEWCYIPPSPSSPHNSPRGRPCPLIVCPFFLALSSPAHPISHSHRTSGGGESESESESEWDRNGTIYGPRNFFFLGILEFCERRDFLSSYVPPLPKNRGHKPPTLS